MNVLVAVVAMSATLPGRTYGLGLIKEPKPAGEAKGDGKEAARAPESKDAAKPTAPKDASARDLSRPRGPVPAARP